MLPASPALVVEMDKRLATGALWLQWFSSPNHSILDQQDGCKSQQNLLHAEGKQSKNRSTDKLTKGLQCYKRKGSHKQQEENYIRKVQKTDSNEADLGKQWLRNHVQRTPMSMQKNGQEIKETKCIDTVIHLCIYIQHIFLFSSAV